MARLLRRTTAAFLLIATLVSYNAMAEPTCCTLPTITADQPATGPTILIPGNGSTQDRFRVLLSPSGRAHNDVFGGAPLTFYLTSTCPGELGAVYQETNRFWLGEAINTSAYLCQGADASGGAVGNALICGTELWPSLPINFVYKTSFAVGSQELAFHPSGGVNDSISTDILDINLSWVSSNSASFCPHAGYGNFPQGLFVRSTDTDGDGDTDEADERRLNRTPHGVAGDYAMDLNFDSQVTSADHQIMVAEILRNHTTSRAFGAEGGINCATVMKGYEPSDYVRLPPEDIVNFTAARVNGSLIRLSWRAPNEGLDDSTLAASGYQLRRSTSPITSEVLFDQATVISSPPTPSTRGVTQTFDVSDDGKYYFGIRAKDDVENWSAIAATQLPPDQSTTLVAVAGRDMVKLVWTATGASGNLGQATSCEVRYSTTGPISSESAWSSATIVSGTPFAPETAGTSQCLTISGLDCSPTYRFALRTTNAQGQVSAISNSPSAKPKCTGSLTYSCGGASAQQSSDPDEARALGRVGLAHPNPAARAVTMQLFAPSTVSEQSAELSVFDVSGRRLRSLFEGRLPANRTIEWDLMNDHGRRVPSGLYFVRGRVGSTAVVHSVTVTK